MRSSPPGYRLLSLLVVLLAVGCVVAGVLLWPGRTAVRPVNAGQRDPTRLVYATLTRVLTVPCQSDEQIPADAMLLEAGCGTAQLTNFLGMDWRRRVIGADLCMNSLRLGKGFRDRFETVLRASDFPVELSEIRTAADPLTTTAKGALVAALKAQPKLFTLVENTAEHPFFTRNGFLFPPTATVGNIAGQFVPSPVGADDLNR